MPIQCLRTLYFSMVYPHILYGIEIYANTTKCSIKPLCIAHNKILRAMINTQLSKILSTNELYSSFGLLTIPNLFRYQLFRLVHKYFHHNALLPEIYKNYFTCNYSIHKYFTRQIGDIHVPNSDKNIGQKSIQKLGGSLWNNLPCDLKIITSTRAFSSKLKVYLIGNIVV